MAKYSGVPNKRGSGINMGDIPHRINKRGVLNKRGEVTYPNIIIINNLIFNVHRMS